MILGIGLGKIELVLDKTYFNFGEVIKGKLKLTLKENVEARGLRVRLIEERTIKAFNLSRGTSETRKEEIMLNEVNLAGEQSFSSQDYDFELAIPSSPNNTQITNTLSQAANFFGAKPPIRYLIDASLDIPNKFDVNKKIVIVIK